LQTINAFDRALWIPRRHGHRGRVDEFLGLHANVHGEMRRVVQGVSSDLLARIDRLGDRAKLRSTGCSAN
jgi:hypothetical protein